MSMWALTVVSTTRLQVLQVCGSCCLHVQASQALQHTLGNYGVSLCCGHRLVLPVCDGMEDGVW